MDDKVVIYEGEDYKIITDESEKPTPQDAINAIGFIEHERSKEHIRKMFSKVLIVFFVCVGIYSFLTGKWIINDNSVIMFIALTIMLGILLKMKP